MEIEVKTRFALSELEIQESLLKTFREKTGFEMSTSTPTDIKLEASINAEGGIELGSMIAVISLNKTKTQQ